MDIISNPTASIARVFRQSRIVVRFPRARRLRSRWESVDVARRGERSCLLDIRQIVFDGEQGRRFHSLVALLSRAGYDIYLVPRLAFLQSADKAFKWSAVQQTNVYHPDTSPSLFDLCLTDARKPVAAAKRCLGLVFDTSRPLSADEVPLPYSFFPPIWDLGEDSRFGEYRSVQRRWRMFFGGNCQQSSYRTIRQFRWLNLVNRFDALNVCWDYYRSRTQRVKNEGQLDQLKSSDATGFVVIDSDAFRLPPSDWLGTLSHACFFLAAPGCDYPLSHNCIEALAIGTVPVLEYDAMFRPHLEDGVNCIAYRGPQGLVEALERIDQLSPATVERLRSGAVKYYEQHLAPQAFARQLTRPNAKRVHMFSHLVMPAA